jgi:hypothetical protein
VKIKEFRDFVALAALLLAGRLLLALFWLVVTTTAALLAGLVGTVALGLLLAALAALAYVLGGKTAWDYWYAALPFLILLCTAVAGWVLVFRSPAAPDGPRNPRRGYGGDGSALVRYVECGIEWLGRLKYYTGPFALVQHRGGYKIKGEEVRTLLGVLREGDILLRGFDGFVDGAFIRWSAADRGPARYFTHVALYLGDIDDARDRPLVATDLQVPAAGEPGRWVAASEAVREQFRSNANYYAPGPQRVVHALAHGVHTEDILSFVRCDYLMVLRLPEQIATGRAGEVLGRDEVLAQVRRHALGEIGSGYNFLFEGSHDRRRYTCAEFVYHCLAGVQQHLGLRLRVHGFLRCLFRRKTISPADIHAAVARGKLTEEWRSGSLQEKKEVSLEPSSQ